MYCQSVLPPLLQEGQSFVKAWAIRTWTNKSLIVVALSPGNGAFLAALTSSNSPTRRKITCKQLGGKVGEPQCHTTCSPNKHETMCMKSAGCDGDAGHSSPYPTAQTLLTFDFDPIWRAAAHLGHRK